MCGRYVLFSKLSEVHQKLLDCGLRVDSSVPDDETKPSYNISPSTFEPVYYATPRDWKQKQKYLLQPMKWGLPVPNTHITTINLRTESLTSTSAPWKTLLRSHRRCIIPANGFYEWLSSGSTKIPYYTKLAEGSKDSKGLNNDLLFFAGLYDISEPVTGNINSGKQNESIKDSDRISETKKPQQRTYTFTILTTTSNPHLRFLHDRMPVILSTHQLPLWLDTTKPWSPELEGLLKPYQGELVTYQVDQEVGKVGHSEAGFIMPVKERTDGIKNAFKMQGVASKKRAESRAKSVDNGASGEEVFDTVEEVEEFLKKEKEKVEDEVKEGLASMTEESTISQKSTAMDRFLSSTPTIKEETITPITEESSNQLFNGRFLGSTPKKEERTTTSQKSTAMDRFLGTTPTKVKEELRVGIVVKQEEEIDPVKEVEEFLAREAEKEKLKNEPTTPNRETSPASQLSPSQKSSTSQKFASTAMERFLSSTPTKVKDGPKTGEKRSVEDGGKEEKEKVTESSSKKTRRVKSATSNAGQRRVKQTKKDGNVKITNFFGSK
ncbi:hypothetical protein FPQ18DRAFT_117411 [Pyronema domesticum]|nr:hypothetical protein FPQ18DRAFT_117411 [Pyronema domesticum]